MRVIAAITLLLLASCGSEAKNPTTPPEVVAITVSGPSTAVASGSTFQFSASVTGTTNSAVTWSVDRIGNTNVGSITVAGLYTAPFASGPFTVRATSVADGSRSGTAVVFVAVRAITVLIAQDGVSLGAGGSVQLTAVVTGSANPGVTWELPGGSTTGSLITTGPANATYSAPNSSGAFQVRATSLADPTKFALATINVGTGSGFRVSGPARVAPGASTPFAASFNDVVGSATWSFDDDAAGCTVSSSGVFTAGTREVTVTLRATDALGRTASVPIAVVSQVTLGLQIPASPTLSTADLLTFY